MKIFIFILEMINSISWEVDDKVTSRDNLSNKQGNNNEGKGSNNKNKQGDRGGDGHSRGKEKTQKTKVKTSELRDYMPYCQATYQFRQKKENYKLERLVVIFRHGDRSPLRNISEDWKKKNCIECPLEGNNINSCHTKRCGSGELTTKGAEQAKKLGNFIKTNYKPLLFEKDIVIGDIGYRTTTIKRTHSTLLNVMAGLANVKSISGVNIKHGNDGLLKPKNCAFLENQIAQDPSIYDTLKDKLDSVCFDDPRKVPDKADEIRCGMCNDVPVSCGNNSCCSDTLSDIVKLSHSTWNKQMKTVTTCERGKKIIFGRFSKDLLDILDSDKLLYLVSAHDGTLSMILSALSSESYPWPPYASALFIEVWCKYGKQFVRLIYNDKVVEFSEFPGEYIPITKFTNFLERMKLEENDLEVLCKDTSPQEKKNSGLKAPPFYVFRNKLIIDFPLF